MGGEIMLSVKTRQEYLKKLGFYEGEIDGVEGKQTKDAYKLLQMTYFAKSRDITGKYNKDTDILLMNARRVQLRAKNFNLTEFECNCKGKYCTGYPTYLDRQLLENLQRLRDFYKKPITITSGLRCQGYNDSIPGSIKKSKHTKGKAVDIAGEMTNTAEKRKSLKAKWYRLPNANYTYSDTPNMGTSVHIDVK